MATRSRGRRLRSVPSGANELVVEAMRVCFERNGKNLAEMFAVKAKHGVCQLAFTCLEPCVEGTKGGMNGCREHLAARYAGVKLDTHRRMESAYGRIRAREIAAAKEEKEAESARLARNEKIAKRVKGRSAA